MDDRAFGNMAFNARDAGKYIEAKPRPEPVGKVGGIRGRIQDRPRRKVRLPGIERCDGYCRKPHQFEAEAGIEIAAEPRNPLAEEPQDRGWRTQRTGSADAKPGHRPIDTKESKVQSRRTGLPALQIAFNRSGEQGDDPFHVLDETDRLRKLPLGRHDRHGEARRNRFLDLADCLIEPQQEPSSETPRKRCPRRRQDSADQSQTDAFKPGNRFLVDPQRGKRQGGKKVRLFPGSQNAHRNVVAERSKPQRRS